MLSWIAIAIIASSILVVHRIPPSLRRAYRGAFVARHGLGVQVSLAVLGTLVMSMLVATLVLPERRPLVELMNVAVIIATVIAGAADLYFFSRRRRG
jgi:hypothetical protein